MSSFSIDAAKAWMQAYAQVLEENKEYLTELDSAIGDADHGTNMARGVNTVAEFANLDQLNLATLFKRVGPALVSKVGDAAGPLYSTFFMWTTKETGDARSLDTAGLSRVLCAGLRGVLDRGKAKLQDKTMVDAMAPVLEAFDAAAATSLAAAATAAGKTAHADVEAITPLLARKERTPYLGERSVGHQDPGATSGTYLFGTLAKVVS